MFHQTVQSSSVVDKKHTMDPLIATNGKLVDELRFERHMNTLLDSFRNYAMLLINDCKCDANEEVVRKLNQLNDEYIGRKSGRTVEQKAVQLLCALSSCLCLRNDDQKW
ncbi:unnamed protein product [Medioppia subpectinata]|uniref:Uncharacterized protein n=1 Tax=Medioppia subpectinata TaxID=1979941 RepID=A0A7R9Q0G5_9ACAR|nr:unnamed protein product [Medioppia subpectinata]CAG2107935.1 unnamed protein product [Medioppia subpectinata]